MLHAIEDMVKESFRSVNSFMQTLASSLALVEADTAAEELLLEQLRTSPQLRAIEFINPNGQVEFSTVAPNQTTQTSQANSTAYACISQLAQQPTNPFVIESPRKGRYPGDFSDEDSTHAYLPFCVPVRDANQQLTGVLVASINPHYFYNLFISITEAYSSYINLYRYDGESLFTAKDLPLNVTEILQRVTSKSWGQFRTPINNANYLVSYRSTSMLPLIVVLIADEAQALASWYHDERMLRIFILLLSFLTAATALALAIIQEKRWQARGDLRLLGTAIRCAANAILITNKDGSIYWVNKAFTQLTGYTFEEAYGKNPRMLNSGHQPKEFFADLWSTILAGKSWRQEVINKHKNGQLLVVDQTITPILDSQNNIEHFISIHEDITARKSAEEKASYLADHDSLTDLPNRRYFERQLGQIFYYSAPQKQLAVLFINLDRFKDINDTLGHEAGDALLVHTANNLKKLINENSMLARLGGDEFALLIKNIRQQKELSAIIGQVVIAVGQPFTYQDKTFNLTCSLGIAQGTSQTSNAPNMLQQAAMAMYRAKQEGKNTYRFFDATMDEQIKRRIYLQQQLEVALKNNSGFSLRYQPQVITSTNQVFGAEALMRWEISPGEWISPFEFIPLAEETGQIIEIGTWLMHHLFQQMADWNEQGVEFGTISMNISAIQLARDNLAERMLNLMEIYQIPAKQLSVEITETTLMASSERVAENLKLLKKAGIILSIDDFGTGYSSMSYLKAIKANHLKIDRSFIIGVGKKDLDEHIIRATIALAHSLKLETVAEGVDSQEQLDFLKQLNCDYIQGYFFAQPLTPTDFEDFLKKDIN